MKVVIRSLTIATIIFWSTAAALSGMYILYDQYPKNYSFNLQTVKSDVAYIDKMASKLRDAHPQDTVTIYVTSYGGEVVILNKILNAIKDSKAHVVTISDGAAISAGSLIALAGDEIVIKDHTLFLFHLARQVGFGRVVVLPLNSFGQIQVLKLMDEYVEKYLLDDEIIAILKGKDLRISGAEMQYRLIAFKNRNTKDRFTKFAKQLLKRKNAKELQRATRVAN